MTQCESHPGENTEWSCAVCGRPLCGKCGGAAWQGAVYCPDCVRKSEAALQSAAERTERKRRRAGRLAAAAVLLGVIGGAFILHLGCGAFSDYFLQRRYDSALPMAPDFKARDLQGSEVSLAALQGKVVVLEFWASWCGSCEKIKPALKELHRGYADRGLVMLGISSDEKRRDMEEALAKHGIAWPQIWDRSGRHASVSELYGVTGIPAVFFIDKRGRLYQKWGRFDSRMSIYVEFLLSRPGDEAPGTGF